VDESQDFLSPGFSFVQVLHGRPFQLPGKGSCGNIAYIVNVSNCIRQMPTPVAYLGEFEQLLLLAILQCGDEAYTVPIRHLLTERTGRRVSRGAVHTSLERLEAKGLLSSRLGEPLAVRGGRPRRYFTPTPAGLDALRASRRALLTLSRGLESVLDGRS